MNLYKKLGKIKKKYEDKMLNQLTQILNGLFTKDIDVDGLTKKEIAKLLFEKDYVSYKEEQIVYSLLIRYRSEVNPQLVCVNRKYGFIQTEEELEKWAKDRIHNSCGRLTKTKKIIEGSNLRLGFKTDAVLMIQSEVDKVLE